MPLLTRKIKENEQTKALILKSMGAFLCPNVFYNSDEKEKQRISSFLKNENIVDNFNYI